MEDNVVRMVQQRASKYGSRVVCKYKPEDNGEYKPIAWNSFWEVCQNVGRSLIGLGFGGNTNIGILSDNCPMWTMSDVGILAAGSVVVPIFAGSSKE